MQSGRSAATALPATIAALLFAAAGLEAQRCGDHLLLAFRGADGKRLRPGAFVAVKVSTENVVDNITNRHTDNVGTGEVAGEGTLLEVRTGCGFREVGFRVELGREVMTIVLFHVPGDSGNILLDGIEFRPGRFELDLGWDTLAAAISIERPALAINDGLEGPRYILRQPALRRVD